MKIEDAVRFIEAHPNKRMSELWSELLRDSWQDGLFEVQSLLESVSIGDVSLWALQSGSLHLEAFAASLTRELKLPDAIEPTKLSKLLSRQLDAEKIEILEKIASIADDRGLDFLDFLSEVRASANLASQVQKNATKKGLYEPAAAAFIKLRSSFDVLVLAHAENRLSIRFSNSGRVGLNSKAADPYSKDADLVAFTFDQFKCHAFLISHKYARVGGGHQMNQRSDAAKFLAYANEALIQNEALHDLRKLIEESTSKSIRESEFSWEPALILDGEFFHSAPSIIRAEESYPKLRSSQFFIGNVDDFVDLAPIN